MTLLARRAEWAAIACALVALALREPGWGAVGVVAAAGAVGVLVAATRGSVDPSRWAAVAAAGALPFLAVRLTWPSPPASYAVLAVAASILAAVAEEALFRRALYARLERWGPAVAVAVSAVAFAAVHVPVYGWGALWVDAGAGLVFGWQRWASGTWTAPAATHALANLMQMG